MRQNNQHRDVSWHKNKLTSRESEPGGQRRTHWNSGIYTVILQAKGSAVFVQFLGKESVNQEFRNKDHNQTFSGTENSANEEIRQNEPFEVSKTMEENWR